MTELQKLRVLLYMGPAANGDQYMELWNWALNQDVAVVRSLQWLRNKMEEQNPARHALNVEEGPGVRSALVALERDVTARYQILPEVKHHLARAPEKIIVGMLVDIRLHTLQLFWTFYEGYIQDHHLDLTYKTNLDKLHYMEKPKLRSKVEPYRQFLLDLLRWKFVSPDLYNAWAEGMFQWVVRRQVYQIPPHPYRIHYSLAKARRERLLTKGDGGEGDHEAHLTSRQYSRYHA